MEKTIVVLLILFIFSQLLSIYKNSRMTTKKNTIDFHKEKIDKAESFKGSDGIITFAFLIALSIRITVIYFALQSIMWFIK